MGKMTRLAVAIMSGATCAVLSAGAAEAVKSYQGSDYSQDYNTRKYIETCDMESDSTPVKGIYEMNTGSSGDVKDADGNNGVCGSKNAAGTTSNYINRHKTCEYRSFWPDECGNWQAT